jgi:hypothetical protein
MNAQEGTTLELREEGWGSKRHYVEDRDVHCGDTLELRLEGGNWLRGRYEWTGREADRPGFYIDFDHAMFLKPHDVLRWPRR